MSLCNRYAYRSRLSEAETRHLVKCFALDLDATKTSVLTGVSRVTVNRYFLEIRRAIYANSVREKITRGSVELDESYFGARRVRGKRGRGAGNKTVVFGILSRKGSVYAEIVPDAKKDSLIPSVLSLVSKRATVYTDSWRSYNCLCGMGYRHRRVNHGSNEFSKGRGCHVNGIESFWAYSKRRLVKFCGVGRFFDLHLRECEFRFNFRSCWKSIYKALLKMFLKSPLFFKGAPPVHGSVHLCDGGREVAQDLESVDKPDAPHNEIFTGFHSWHEDQNSCFLDFLKRRVAFFLPKNVTNITKKFNEFFRLLSFFVLFCNFLL